MAALRPRFSPMFLLLFILPLGIPAQPSSPEIGGPSDRVDSGAVAPFRCDAYGFPSEDITATWTKDRNQIQSPPLHIIQLENETSLYFIISIVQVPLTEKDIHSTLTCQIDSRSLKRPLQQVFYLGDVLRVVPHVTVETSLSSPIPLNHLVTLTCVVNNFYPNNISVAWWTSDSHNFAQRTDSGKRNANGTFFVRLPLSTRKNRPSTTNYTCRVIHDSQSPVYVTKVLRFGMQPKENGNARFIESGPYLLSSPGLWIGLLLGKIVSAFLLFYLLLRISAGRHH